MRPLKKARHPLKESREGRGWHCRDRRPWRCRQNRRPVGPRGLQHLEREPGRVNATRQRSVIATHNRGKRTGNRT